MYYDLDVCVSPNARPVAIELLASLGYHTIAFTTVIKDVKKLTQDHLPKKVGTQSSNEAGSLMHTDASQRTKRLKVLYRATLIVDDTSQLGILSSNILNAYDIVAVRPGSEKVLQQCLQADIDIVSLPMDRRQLFFVKRPQIHVAVSKGVHFEISYALALRDTNTRRFLISNAGALSRSSGGQHLIFSSGAKTPMELRGPHDVINLGILFDVPQEHAQSAVSTNSAAAVAHGDIRARVHKGIVRVEKVEQGKTADIDNDSMHM